MCSYIDGPSQIGVAGGGRVEVEDPHSWAAFTDARLCWLYGENHLVARAALTLEDRRAWRALGEREAA